MPSKEFVLSLFSAATAYPSTVSHLIDNPVEPNGVRRYMAL